MSQMMVIEHCLLKEILSQHRIRY